MVDSLFSPGDRVRIGNCLRIVGLIVLPSLAAQAQNSCGTTPPTGTCPAASAPVQTWCAGNNSSSTCPGGTAWVGFSTTSPATGSWSTQFEGIDAGSILGSGQKVRPQADPNGGIGPTNAHGVGQYLEFANNYVQAFDRATGNGVFSTWRNTSAAPQPITTAFSPGGASYCTNGSLDGIASYDRIDGVFVLANIFNPGAQNTYYYCIGVSAPSGSVPANNLEGSNSLSYWNVYAYQITPAIPKNSLGHRYFPDYARFGTWSDGFYVTWDLEDINQNYDIVGFEVCKLDKANMLAGLSTNPPVCYTYIPNYIAEGTNNSLIHTLLPADFEGNNPIPAGSAGEYFLAQVNPSNAGTNVQCSVMPCASNQLAFWTWLGFASGAGPTYITLPTTPYTPGCYSPSHPYNTICIPEPYGGVSDSVGDRLMYRLAYRYITLGSTPGEYLAVVQTVQEATKNRRTGIRYYKILAGSSPAIMFQGDIQDTTNYFFYSMPSIAMDKSGDLGIAFTATGSTVRGSAVNYDPSPFMVTVGASGKKGTPVAILSNSGASGQDETDNYWGEYISVSADPNDDLTFWAVDEYMNGNQTGNCTSTIGTGCTWATRVNTCKKGSGC